MTHTRSITKSAILAALLLFPASAFCQVTGVIGVKFGFTSGTGYAVPTDLAPTDAAGILVAGDLAVSNWNNLLVASVSPLSASENVTWPIAQDSAGNALSGVTLTPAGFNDGWYSGGSDCPNARLLEAFWKLNLGDANPGVGTTAGGHTYATITLSNLPASTYDVYVYVNDNNGNYWGNIEANTVIALGTNVDDAGFNGDDRDPCGLTPQLHTATGFGNPANYMEMPAVATTAGGTIVISVVSFGGGEIAVPGVELVPTGTSIASYPPLFGAFTESPATASSGILPGTDVTLTDEAFGELPITYQWQTDGGSGSTPTNIPSATSTNLVVNTTGWGAGTYVYDLVASNSLGTSTSSDINIVVPVTSPTPGIGVQFEGGGNGYQTLNPGMAAGYVPHQSWNVDDENTGVTDTNLVDNTGAPTAAKVNVTFNAGHYGSGDNTSTPDGILMSGGFWSGGGYTVNMTGVPYTMYNVYLYMLNDNNPNRRYGFSLGAQTYWGSVFSGGGYSVPPYTLDTQTTELGKGSQMQATVVQFTNIIGGSFSIAGQTPDGNVALMGMEITALASSGPPAVGSILTSPSYAANGVVAGQIVTLTDLAVGSPTISYQWQTDGGSGSAPTNIPGATGTNLVVNTAGLPGGIYVFDLVAANSLGTNSSVAINITVVPAIVAAPGVSIQFEGDGNSSTLNSVTLAAGYLPHQFWNVDDQGSGGTDANLIDYTGAPTGASVTVQYGNGQYHSSDNTSTPDGILMSGGYWAGGGYTITASNVPYSTYEVLLYMLNDDNPERRYGFTLGSQTYWGSVFDGNGYSVPPYTLDTETTELAEGTQMQATVVQFTNITGSSFTITGLTPDGNVALMGMQVLDIYTGPAIAGPVSISTTNTIYPGVPFQLSELPISGAPPLFYQWLTDGGSGGTLTNIPTATNSTLSVDTTPLAPGSYNYEVAVSNSIGSSTSAVFTVTIETSAPLLVTDITPAPLSEGYVGQTLTYPVTFIGTLPITYQWMVDTGSGPTAISASGNPSAITSTLVLSNLQFANAGTYSLAASNIVGGNVSSTSTLTVLADLPAPGAGTYGALELADGPVAYWRLNETEDASTGILPAYDASGHNLDGLYGVNSENGFNNISGPQSPGFPGFEANNTALQTENAAPDTYVTVPPLNLNTNAATITAWIYPTHIQTVFNSVFKWQNELDTDAAGLGFGPTVNSGGMAALGYTWNSNSAATYNWNSGLFPLSGQWSFVALVITPTDSTIYLYYIDPNTSLPDLYSAVNPLTNQVESFEAGTTLIGSDPDSVESRTFFGDIDEVAVFNQALSSAQILGMFTKAAGISGGIAPQITGQPEPVGTFANQTIAFSATGINGTSPFGYQWQYITAAATNNLTNGGNISGATTSTLTISNVTSADAGSYQVTVTNSVGTTISSNAALVVATPVPGSYEAAVVQYHPFAFWPLNETNANPASGDAFALEYANNFVGTYQIGAQDGFNGIVGPESPALPGFPATNTALATFLSVSNSYVSASAGALIATNITYTAWINPSGPVANWAGILMDRGSPTTGTGFGFGGTVNGSGVSELAYTWNDNNQDTWGFDSLLFPAIDEWSFVALVVEPSQATIYLIGTNGVVQSTNNVIPQDSEEFAVAWHIGNDAADGGNGGRTFSGSISSVAVFLSALSSAQIETLADVGFGITPPVVVNIAKSGPGTLTLSWSSGTLLQTTNLVGPWVTNAAATSPYNISPTNAQQFFKVVQ